MNFKICTIILQFLNCYSFADEIRISYHIRPPFYTKKKDGIIDKKLKFLEKETKIKFIMEEYPVKRALKIILQNKEKFCLGSVYFNKEREKIGKFSVPIYHGKAILIVVRKNDNRFSKKENASELLKNNKILPLFKIGYSYGKYIDKIIKDNNININNTTADVQTMLIQISKNRADYMFIGSEEANYFLQNNNYDLKKNLKLVPLSDIIVGENRYILCSNLVTNLEMNKINKALLKISDY